jgi:GH43 family beta-xylosidase
MVRKESLLILLACGVIASAAPNTYSNSSVKATFANPVIEIVSADPSIFRHNGWYYLTLAGNDQITIYRSLDLTNFRGVPSRIVYIAPPGRGRLWAPELHFVRGNLYIYFTMDDTRDDQMHRMYVIRAQDPNDPLGAWGAEKRVSPNEELYAIDGTVMQYGNGRLYFIWVGNPDAGSMGLFIAPMEDPETVLAPRILLRRPKSEWEMHGFPVNEGPFIIENEGRTFLVFSASSTFTPDYCLGIMGIDDLKDPLVPSNWWNDKDECVFRRNDAEGVFGTGHATFVKSPDNTETWMFYHAVNDVNDPGINRFARTQKLEWNPDRAPRFPEAVGVGRQLPGPSGQ